MKPSNSLPIEEGVVRLCNGSHVVDPHLVCTYVVEFSMIETESRPEIRFEKDVDVE